MVSLWITQVVALKLVYFGLFSDSEFGTYLIFGKDSEFASGWHMWYQSEVLESLIRQVVGGGDTKAGDIIPQWQSSCRIWGHEGWWYYPTIARVRRWGHEASRYYLMVAREVRSGPMGYPFQPNEEVTSPTSRSRVVSNKLELDWFTLGPFLILKVELNFRQENECEPSN